MYGHVTTKFSRMGGLPLFFTNGAPLRALRARELRIYAVNELNLVPEQIMPGLIGNS